jgi:amino acid adenylation domain-containing protein
MTDVLHLASYLEQAARRWADRVAVVDVDGSELSYAELNQRADRAAGMLASRGVAPGDRVGVVLPKSAAALCAMFGAMKIRAAYVPVDWTAPTARIRTVLSDCAVRAVFVHEDRREVAEGFDTTIVAGVDDLFSHAPADPPAGRDPEDLAYLLYTSGSTGTPKGVMLTQRNATSFVEWCSEVFSPEPQDCFSSHAPFHFDLSILDIYVALKHGAKLCLVPEDLGKNPRDLARFIAERRISVWYSTPSILSLLAEFGGLSRGDFSALRLVLFAGEVFPVKHLKRLTELWPAPVYYNLYGPTETNVCTYARIPLPIPVERAEPYPIGAPCSHCKAMVLDDEGEPVACGAEGLLYIAGPSVCTGYWRRTRETAERFREIGGTPWYNTGDVVREESGNGFVYVGRRDRMVKRRGYRIELGDVESALYRHPQVREAAVLAMPDSESGVKILAYLALERGDAHPSVIALKRFCHDVLPDYMIPDLFLFREALPHTSTNKLDYQSLLRESVLERGVSV